MGTWSGEPFGNDVAADFAWELDEQKRWNMVRDALREALQSEDPLDADTAAIAIAAAEVVAHGLGRPTQSDVYTESVEGFVSRARKPSGRLVKDAERAVTVAASADSELAELWAESDAQEWHDSNERLLSALMGR
ncbi:hypothetical protein FHX49_001371 [Microbacterium endophyticum]|uniref:DUF4259 domain-containing protein n=1 Tax=Microbacterium endophyticum TaxID=1526412 RepID=A0A7W4YMS4_9MICO|nr:DUF4259 domain-containing protein [Microbacterium endophyticum]MBB2975804.1 hypothetical protein [Microbacterium endophyticum]NIK36287.1 hypothetical protein [Microbacterium endophyticum]